MTINYTTLLGLALPVTGTESGTWGDDVSNGITQYIDASVAGTQSITTDADVTLSLTNGSSAGTNLSSTSAQYMQLLCTGSRTANRYINVPNSSKMYVVNNSTTGGYTITVRGVTGPTTGVTIANGEKCIIYWNSVSGDFVKVSSVNTFSAISATSLTLTGSGTVLTIPTSGNVQGDFSNATVLNRTLFQTSATNSSTGIYAVPNGTATAASWQATNAADPTNASKVLIATNGTTDVQLVSGINGTGTYLPLTFFNGGSGRFVIGTSGQFGIGPTATVNYGTAGQALLSGGPSAAPTWGSAGISTGKSIAMAMVFGF